MAGPAPSTAPPAAGKGWGVKRLAPQRALAGRGLRDARTRTLAFGSLFAIYSYIQPVGFRSAYPRLADRLAFAHSFGNNDAIRLFYGYPYDVASIGGYTAWRVGGTLAIAAAVFGVLAAVRALRAEEDSGRMELVLAGVLGRRGAFSSSVAVIVTGLAILWFAECAGFLAGGLALEGSALLATSTLSVAAVFVGIGALTSQLAPTRRIALELGSALVALFLLLRVVADTSGGAGWLRWITPLGWAEETRPFTAARPAVLLLALGAATLMLLAAARIAVRRDIGTGLLGARDSPTPSLALLSSPVAQTLRSERVSLLTWIGTTGAFALVLGVVSSSVSSAGISKAIRREIARIGSGSIATPQGYLAFVFIFFILAVSLFGCSQISVARQEESGEQLETLLALPVGRRRWFAGRLLLAAASVTVLALVAGALTWVGAAVQGVPISLPQMLEAGANCLPVALLFLGVGALAYAVVPRASTAVAYGFVIVAFVWYLVGALFEVPHWLVELTPFAHVGFVPVEAFRTGAALIMLAIAAATTLAAISLFRRRDLTTA